MAKGGENNINMWTPVERNREESTQFRQEGKYHKKEENAERIEALARGETPARTLFAVLVFSLSACQTASPES